MNLINGNVNTITNEVGGKADVLSPIISLFGETKTGISPVSEKSEELALVA